MVVCIATSCSLSVSLLKWLFLANGANNSSSTAGVSHSSQSLPAFKRFLFYFLFFAVFLKSNLSLLPLYCTTKQLLEQSCQHRSGQLAAPRNILQISLLLTTCHSLNWTVSLSLKVHSVFRWVLFLFLFERTAPSLSEMKGLSDTCYPTCKMEQPQLQRSKVWQVEFS